MGRKFKLIRNIVILIVIISLLSYSWFKLNKGDWGQDVRNFLNITDLDTYSLVFNSGLALAIGGLVALTIGYSIKKIFKIY